MANKLNDYSVRRLALIYSKQCEILAMSADNDIAIAIGGEPVFNGEAFIHKSKELEDLAYVHNDQLFK